MYIIYNIYIQYFNIEKYVFFKGYLASYGKLNDNIELGKKFRILMQK